VTKIKERTERPAHIYRFAVFQTRSRRPRKTMKSTSITTILGETSLASDLGPTLANINRAFGPISAPTCLPVFTERFANRQRPQVTSLKRGSRPRLYYEIGCRFPGGGWADLEIGLDRLPQWDRIAIVTDTASVRQTVKALRFLLASDVRVFTSFEVAESRAWITSPGFGHNEPGLAPIIAPLAAPVRLPCALPPRSRRLSSRPVRPGGRRYRRPSAGGR
jgi:hypothetical protein